MEPNRTAGMILIAGSILFLTAAFMPISRLYAKRDSQERLTIIRLETAAWNASMMLFGLGAPIMVVGLLSWVLRLRAESNTPLIFAAVVSAGIGTVLWDWHIIQRTIQPERFVNGLLPGWMFPAYSLLTQLALLMLGIILMSAQPPRWLGIVNIGAAILFAGLYARFRDVPPFVYYLITLLDGIILVL